MELTPEEIRNLANAKDWDSLESNSISPADLEALGYSEEAIEEYNRFIYANTK